MEKAGRRRPHQRIMIVAVTIDPSILSSLTTFSTLLLLVRSSAQHVPYIKARKFAENRGTSVTSASILPHCALLQDWAPSKYKFENKFSAEGVLHFSLGRNPLQ
jgi:hypothetical protein